MLTVGLYGFPSSGNAALTQHLLQCGVRRVRTIHPHEVDSITGIDAAILLARNPVYWKQSCRRRFPRFLEGPIWMGCTSEAEFLSVGAGEFCRKVSENKTPVLFIAYEWLVSHPQETGDMISKWLGFEPAPWPEMRDENVKYTTPALTE